MGPNPSAPDPTSSLGAHSPYLLDPLLLLRRGGRRQQGDGGGKRLNILLFDHQAVQGLLIPPSTGSAAMPPKWLPTLLMIEKGRLDYFKQWLGVLTMGIFLEIDDRWRSGGGRSPPLSPAGDPVPLLGHWQNLAERDIDRIWWERSLRLHYENLTEVMATIWPDVVDRTIFCFTLKDRCARSYRY